MSKIALILIIVIALIVAGFIQIAYMDYNTYNYYNGLSMPIIDFGYTLQSAVGMFNNIGNDFKNFLDDINVLNEQFVLKELKYSTNVNQYAYMLVYLPINTTMETIQADPFEAYRIYAVRDIEGYEAYWNNESEEKYSHMINLTNYGGYKYIWLYQHGQNNVGYPNAISKDPNESNRNMEIVVDTNPTWIANNIKVLQYRYFYGNGSVNYTDITYTLIDITDVNTNIDISQYTYVIPY